MFNKQNGTVLIFISGLILTAIMGYINLCKSCNVVDQPVKSKVKSAVLTAPTTLNITPTKVCQGIQRYKNIKIKGKRKVIIPTYISCGLCTPERGWKNCKEA
jgi:hypothetical protein